MLHRLAVLLSLGVLAGCAVVDLAAHGINEYEKSRPSDSTASAGSAGVGAPASAPEAAAPTDGGQPATVTASGAIRSQPLD